jgi:hypothetical protein
MNYLMENDNNYTDRYLKYSLDFNIDPIESGASQYLNKHGFSRIKNLFVPNKEFNIDETESILSNIYKNVYKITNITNAIYYNKEQIKLSNHNGMSLFLQVNTNSFIGGEVNIGNLQLELNNNEAIFYNRKKINFSVSNIKSRYNLIGKLLNKLSFKNDDTYYHFIQIDYEVKYRRRIT